MTNTQLMVLPQHPVVKQPSNEVAEYDALHDGDVEFGESLEEVQAEVAALELRYGADSERCTKVISKLNENNKELLTKINLIHAKLIAKQMELEDSDDLEDKANAEDLKKIMEESFGEDTDHETRDNEHDADIDDTLDRLNKAKMRDRCKRVYKAIARATHPDRCRNKSKEEKQRRQAMFLQAKELLLKLDLEGLELIHTELYGKTSEPINLMQRLLMARQKREELRKKMEELRGSPEWQLYCLSLHHGIDVADDQYRMSLEQTLHGLTQMLNDLENPQSETYTHWV